MSAFTAIPDANFVAGFSIVTGTPIQDDDLLVFKTALNGWVFEQASAIGVTLANLSINVDKDWLGRNIFNLGNLSFNQGTAFAFSTFSGNVIFTIEPLLATTALTGLTMLMKDRNSETIERVVEYQSSRVLDKMTQEALTASLVPLYQMETVIQTSNDVVAADAIIEYSLVSGASAVVNRSLFQINNLLTPALELTVDHLEIFGDRVFIQSQSQNLFVTGNITGAVNTTLALTTLDFTMTDMKNSNALAMITVDLHTAGTNAGIQHYTVFVQEDSETPIEMGEGITGGSGLVTNCSFSITLVPAGKTIKITVNNDSSGGSLTVFGNTATPNNGHSKLTMMAVG